MHSIQHRQFDVGEILDTRVDSDELQNPLNKPLPKAMF
jgi:hypothetical protein